MAETYSTIEECEKWFLENSSGQCQVRNAANVVKLCSTFQEAKEHLEAGKPK